MKLHADGGAVLLPIRRSINKTNCYYISIRQVKEELKILERAGNSEEAIYLKKEELLKLRKKKKEVCTESTSSLEEEMVPSGTPLRGQEANLRAAWAHLCDMFECNGPDRFAEEAKQTQNDDGELIQEATAHSRSYRRTD